MYASFYSRKLMASRGGNTVALGPSAMVHSPAQKITRPGGDIVTNSFNTKVIIVTAALLLVLILALCINIATRWLLRLLIARTSPLVGAESAAGPKTNTGMKKRHLNALPTVVYSVGTAEVAQDENASSSQCPICLVDFRSGERIRVLPKCQHGFHVGCIDTWLSKHASCPTCRGDLMDTLLDDDASTGVQLQIDIAP